MKALGIEMMVSATTRHFVTTGRNPQFVFANYLFGHELIADRMAIVSGLVNDKVAELALKDFQPEFKNPIMGVINDIIIIRDFRLDMFPYPIVLARILPIYVKL